jgi:transcriptional regulator with XRE-family HTH domain
VADDDKLPDQAEERFAANLRAARERAGLSQEALAAQMRELGFGHIRQQTVAQIEASSRSVRLGEALALSRITRTSIDVLVRPQGLAQDSWRLLDTARKVQEAHKALADWAGRLSTARQDLRRSISRAEQAGLTDALADELYAARRAVAADVIGVARLLADEWLADIEIRPGRTLSGDERDTALAVSTALRELAEDEGPPESRQEAAVRLAHKRAEAALDVLVRGAEGRGTGTPEEGGSDSPEGGTV